MAETCDIAVVGLGALGSSTAWHAASRGMRVVGFDAFGFGHDRGASHDTSRIIRHSYHTPAYVALTFGAYDDWARLEEETGEQFVTVTGGLDLYPSGAAIRHGRLHGVDGRPRHRLRRAGRRRGRGTVARVLVAGGHRRDSPGPHRNRACRQGNRRDGTACPGPRRGASLRHPRRVDPSRRRRCRRHHSRRCDQCGTGGGDGRRMDRNVCSPHSASTCR